VEHVPNDPSDGYGPRNAAQLVFLDVGWSFKNTDNYRQYIVSKYFQFICRREFTRQDDTMKDDRMIPAGSNGQVPFPGEDLEQPTTNTVENPRPEQTPPTNEGPLPPARLLAMH